MRKRILSKKIAATFLVAAMMAVPVFSGATAFAADEDLEGDDYEYTVDASSEDKTFDAGGFYAFESGVYIKADNGNKATVNTDWFTAISNGVVVNNINNSSAVDVEMTLSEVGGTAVYINDTNNESIVDVNSGEIKAGSEVVKISNINNGSTVDVVTSDITSNDLGVTVDNIKDNSNVKVKTENVSAYTRAISISNVYGSSVEVDTKNIECSDCIKIDNRDDNATDNKSEIKVKTGDIISSGYCIDSINRTNGSVDIEVNNAVSDSDKTCVLLYQTKKGTTNLTVNGDVVTTSSTGVLLLQGDESKINLVVDGDIYSRSDGISYRATNENATTDVLVRGTISSKNAPVLFNSYNSSVDYLARCLSLTAWRIIPNINGDIVWLDYNSSRHPEMKEELEKKIMYIIKVEQPTEGGKISVSDKDGNALATSHDYEVANEGDIVKINPEKGYKLTAVYNGVDGNKLDVIPDSNGNYYVVVPRGGGVYLTATLEKEKYDISFYDEEGNLIQTNNVEYGSTITIPNAPTKDGYEFLYWEGSKYYPGDQYTVTGPHTFKAIWKKVDEKPADKKDEDASADNKDDDSSADKKDENTAADSDSKTTDNTSDKKEDSVEDKTSAETATNISKPVASASPATADNTNLLMVFIVMMLSASCAALAGNLKYKLNK